MEHISDPIAYARDVVGCDPMATFLGVHIDEVRQGYARCSLLVKPEYLNAADRAHGVTVCAVADQAFAVACNSLGTKALAVSLKLPIRLLRLRGILSLPRQRRSMWAAR